MRSSLNYGIEDIRLLSSFHLEENVRRVTIAFYVPKGGAGLVQCIAPLLKKIESRSDRILQWRGLFQYLLCVPIINGCLLVPVYVVSPVWVRPWCHIGQFWHIRQVPLWYFCYKESPVRSPSTTVRPMVRRDSVGPNCCSMQPNPSRYNQYLCFLQCLQRAHKWSYSRRRNCSDYPNSCQERRCCTTHCRARHKSVYVVQLERPEAVNDLLIRRDYVPDQ